VAGVLPPDPEPGSDPVAGAVVALVSDVSDPGDVDDF
jgi:hypothetical protein